MLDHNYTITELDNMLPWEKKIYIDILIQKLKDQAESLERPRDATI